MTVRLLPHAGAMSEFQGFTGDCGQTAELACLHNIQGLDLSATQLNAMVRDQITKGLAGPTGAEPLSSIRADLTARNVPTTTYPYAEPFMPFDAELLPLLRQWAGVKPIILELAQGGKLPGHTDPGLHYHFIAILGIQPEGYLCCDGDHPAAAQGQLVNYSRGDLQGAVPCGMIVCETAAVAVPAPDPIPAPPSVPATPPAPPPPAPAPTAVPTAAVTPLTDDELLELRRLLAAVKSVANG